MKATGIVRRIDELGRVVIPKEIRRTMRIKEGEELEIFTNDEGELIFKKFSSMNLLSSLAKEYCKLLSSVTQSCVLMADNDIIIEGAGKMSVYYIGKKLTNTYYKKISERKIMSFGEGEGFNFVNSDSITPVSMIVAPIIKSGDIFGSLILLSERSKFSESEITLVKTAVEFIACSL